LIFDNKDKKKMFKNFQKLKLLKKVLLKIKKKNLKNLGENYVKLYL